MIMLITMNRNIIILLLIMVVMKCILLLSPTIVLLELFQLLQSKNIYFRRPQVHNVLTSTLVLKCNDWCTLMFKKYSVSSHK